MLALLISFALPARAQVPVEVQPLEGQPITGRLTAITSDGIQLDNGSNTLSVRLTQVVSLRITDLQTEPTPPIASSGWTMLATGDQLRVVPLVIDDVSVVTKWAKFPALRPLAIPLEVCRGIVFQLPADAIRQGQVFTRLLERRDESDQVVLRNGDRIEGEFVDVSEGRIVLKTTLGEVPADMSQARSLVFNPDLISVPEHDGPFATLVLRDGSTLLASEVQSDGDELLVHALAGFKVALPVTTFREIRFYGGRRISAATLPMSPPRTTPYLSVRRSPRVGRNVTGGLLSIRGRRFATGLGVSSGTDLTWPLDGEYESFQATIGIDDVANGHGSVVCEVLVDGASAWKSERLTGQSSAVTLPSLPLNGASELTLRTHFADRGHVFDFANWCDPLLIRKD
jgi:hypothetical protein